MDLSWYSAVDDRLALDAAVEIPFAAQLLELSAPSAPLDVGIAPMLCYALGGAVAAAGAIARTPVPRAPRLVLCAVAFGLTTLAAVIAEHHLADAVVYETGGIAVALLVRDVLISHQKSREAVCLLDGLDGRGKTVAKNAAN